MQNKKELIPREVIFNLQLPHKQNELPIILMLARNYTRDDIVACFDDLEKNGFGKFDRGSRGKGHFAKFIPNDKMPQEYKMTIYVKPQGRPKKIIEQKG